tara:strand:+ start:1014 stop:1340 length:327 start_codon:yes stop_codon:yes gene_type:complete
MKKLSINGKINRDHPDLKILLDICDCEDYLGTSSGSTEYYRYDGHYLRIRSLRYWGPESIQEYENDFDKVNKLTKQYNFQIVDHSDYEVEFDNDRYYDASLSFIVQLK